MRSPTGIARPRWHGAAIAKVVERALEAAPLAMAVALCFVLTGCHKRGQSTRVTPAANGLIAFGAATASAEEQWVIDPVTGKRTRADGLAWGASWSPQGTAMAGFAGSRAPNGLRIWRLATGRLETVRCKGAPEGLWGHVTWSPDGQRLVVADYGPLWLLDLRTRRAQQLTQPGRPWVEWPDASQPDDEHATWSPDGQRVAFLRRLKGSQQSQLWAVRPDTREEEQLGELQGSVELNPAGVWSRDARYLALDQDEPVVGAWVYDFERHSLSRFGPDRAHRTRLAFSPVNDELVYLSDASGRQRVYLASHLSDEAKVLEGSGGEDYRANWSPDGKQLVVVGRSGGHVDLWIQPAAPGAPPRRLTDDEATEMTPFWSPS